MADEIEYGRAQLEWTPNFPETVSEGDRTLQAARAGDLAALSRQTGAWDSDPQPRRRQVRQRPAMTDAELQRAWNEHVDTRCKAYMRKTIEFVARKMRPIAEENIKLRRELRRTCDANIATFEELVGHIVELRKELDLLRKSSLPQPVRGGEAKELPEFLKRKSNVT